MTAPTDDELRAGRESLQQLAMCSLGVQDAAQRGDEFFVRRSGHWFYVTMFGAGIQNWQLWSFGVYRKAVLL